MFYNTVVYVIIISLRHSYRSIRSCYKMNAFRELSRKALSLHRTGRKKQTISKPILCEAYQQAAAAGRFVSASHKRQKHEIRWPISGLPGCRPGPPVRKILPSLLLRVNSSPTDPHISPCSSTIWALGRWPVWCHRGTTTSRGDLGLEELKNNCSPSGYWASFPILKLDCYGWQATIAFCLCAMNERCHEKFSDT